ncbi:MAG: helix-turn-helix domain-containing protein [Spirochaetes bacterium]|nr:helix-turn-helix domain-containing protein [Spirochaetota bacterium]MBL7005887.1 helix-turn-helix domain-containing protein [Spirochaetia bacterium]
MDTILNIEQVSEILRLHPKTIRAYVREGKIRGAKTGKQWRIKQKDLDAFLNGTSTDYPDEHSPHPMQQEIHLQKESLTINSTERSIYTKIRVSTVIDIDTESEDEAFRLSSSIFAVMNSEAGNQRGSRCDYIYYPETKKARFLIWGTPEFIAEMLKLFLHISSD